VGYANLVWQFLDPVHVEGDEPVERREKSELFRSSPEA
jgi:hypothetical protein